MAEDGEEPVAKDLLKHILTKLNITDGKSIRLDNLWFERYNIDDSVNEWAKGTPDYVLSIPHKETSLNLHTEIKIKDQVFRKTLSGGTTRGGSAIPRYGCVSFYLDIEPVYRNMLDFSRKSNLHLSKFVIDFYNKESRTHHLITLEKLQTIISEGWNGIPIGTFGEGYGQVTYLIPQGATQELTNFSVADILLMSAPTIALPK